MLLEFDIAGAEWVVVAYLCKDPSMLDVVKSGKSPHVVTGMRMSGATEEMIKAEEKLNGKLLDPAVIFSNRKTIPGLLDIATFMPRAMSIRQGAKKANHGLNYDEGYLTFALQNEMDNNDAKKIVDLYKQKVYPGVPKWHKAIREELQKTRTLYNCFGRKCYFMGQIDNDMFKQGYAFKPQSTVVDITNRAMPLMMDDESPEFELAKLYAQVHDSLLIDHGSRDFQLMARFAIKLGMEYMRPVLNYGEDFVLGTTMKAGADWGHMHEVESFGKETNIDALATELEKLHKEVFDKKAA